MVGMRDLALVVSAVGLVAVLTVVARARPTPPPPVTQPPPTPTPQPQIPPSPPPPVEIPPTPPPEEQRPGVIADHALMGIGKRYEFYREHSTCAWARVWYEDGKPLPYITLLHILTYHEFSPETWGYRLNWKTAVIAILHLKQVWDGRIAEYTGYVTPQGWMDAKRQIENWKSLFELENQYHRQKTGLDKYIDVHEGVTLGVDGTPLQPVRIHPYPNVRDRFDVSGCAGESDPLERRECCIWAVAGNFLPCSSPQEVGGALRNTGCFMDYCMPEWCRA